MKECPQCGEQLKDTARFCSNCAAPQSPMAPPSGVHNGPAALGGDAVDARGSQGAVVNPRGPVTQQFIARLYQVYQNAPGPAALTEAEFARVLDDYLAWVQREYGFTRLHGLQTLNQTGALNRPLTHIYTSLIAQARPAVTPGSHRRRDHSEELRDEAAPKPVDMADLLTLGERVAIIGPAGSGKTTYLAFVAATLARALRGTAPDMRLKPPTPDAPWPVPLIAPLRFWQVYREQCAQVNRYHEPEAGTLGGFLLWCLRLRYKNFAAAADFFERLLRGQHGALLLLDGLDEVVQVADRRMVRDALEGLLRSQYPGNRCLVTAREAGYRNVPFGAEFVRCDVQAMTEEQIAALVQAWCAQIYPQAPDAQSAGADLVQVITALNQERTKRGQAALITTPLLTTMVVSVKYSRRELPRERAKLYDACVDVILKSEYTGQEDDLGARQGLVQAGGPPDKQREWLTYLAFQMHQGGAAGASLDESGVRAILEPTFAQRGEAALLERFLASIGHRGGLFEERGGRYQFTHLTFQEFLAAQALAQQWADRTDFLEQNVTAEWWREALLLTVGSLDAPAPYRQREAFIQALCSLEEPAAAVAGAELAAVGLRDLADPEPALIELARERIKALWAATEWPQVSPVLRAAAGNALALLGDDRDLEELIEIPAGPFLMGSADTDKRAGSNEKPQHEVWLPTYEIGKYLVTVGQWKRFIAANPRYKYAPDSLQGYENHPAHHVSWHDARAYCEWLTQEWRAMGKIRADEKIQLPSEAEWEKAASWVPPLPSPPPGGIAGGYKRAYPWGADDEGWGVPKCNAGETGLGGTSPVGLFPEGASPYNCLDMAGNVWEWTRSVYKTYPYKAEDGREDVKATGSWVLRGGSFFYSQDIARCAYRLKRNPNIRNRYSGFRVVVSSTRA